MKHILKPLLCLFKTTLMWSKCNSGQHGEKSHTMNIPLELNSDWTHCFYQGMTEGDYQGEMTWKIIEESPETMAGVYHLGQSCRRKVVTHSSFASCAPVLSISHC